MFEEVEVHSDIPSAIVSVIDPCTDTILKRDKMREERTIEMVFNVDIDSASDILATVETTRVVPGYTMGSKIWEATITTTLME